MPIECRPSNVCSDVRCNVCGQGFLIYGDSGVSSERSAVRKSVQHALRQQHAAQDHTCSGFFMDCDVDAVTQ